MAVEIKEFGRLKDGRPVHQIVMNNAAGTEVVVLDYGATLQRLVFRGVDVLLGYDCMEGYENSSGYLGATVGRVCNRIADGVFSLDGKSVTVACNEESRHGHLHGGIVGFDKKIWDYTVENAGDEPAVRFSYVSPDGEEGYPGTVSVSVTFSLNEKNTLSLHYHGTTDRKTVLNMTNHAYFNPHGVGGGRIETVELKLAAESFTPVNERLIPTGEIRPVADTPLDFRVGKPLGDGIHGSDEQIERGQGVDHNFVLSENRVPLREIAWAYSPKSHIRLICSTDLPGIQVYSGNCLEAAYGKAGHCWEKYDGFCLETQFFPDSVHQPAFPSIELNPGEEYVSTTCYRLEADN